MSKDDDEFYRLVEGYLEPPAAPNSVFAGVKLQWIDGNPKVGSLHIEQEHGVSKCEVEQCLFQIPPEVESKRHRDHPNRVVFWGATKSDRWLFVACEEFWMEGERVLVPVTAFEPDEGRAYWERQ